jgi:hypothetical protein
VDDDEDDADDESDEWVVGNPLLCLPNERVTMNLMQMLLVPNALIDRKSTMTITMGLLVYESRDGTDC